MELYNLASTFKFFLLGLTEDPELQLILFVSFLLIYLLTVLGNVLIILAISSDSHLQSPMYFFSSIFYCLAWASALPPSPKC
ncbi:rCG31834 [Rattus norvegicus]|uniref:RCG31834 n=1 Tax=Rattus norvegicus TaxID=10116 RepID=A6JNH3_RAT|nr:rCG31834 [Rattus norvegicus]